MNYFILFFLLSTAHAAQNPKTVCEEIGTAAQSVFYSDLRQLALQGTPEAIYQRVSSPYSYESSIAPWILNMSPRKETRLAAYYAQLSHAFTFAKDGNYPIEDYPILFPAPIFPNLNNLKRYLQYFSKEKTTYSQDLKDRVKNYIYSRSPDTRIKDLKSSVSFFCSGYWTLNCTAALNTALDRMSPRLGSYAFLSLPEETIELFSDAAYVKPLSIAALKLMKKIENAMDGVAPVQGTIMSDLVEAFREAGFSEKETLARAWKTLGVYSTRGASMTFLAQEGFRYDENTPAFIPMFVISAAMNLLDVLQASGLEHYSLSPEVKTSCIPGKPYHYWNSAYLSMKVREKGYSAKASALSMFISGELYDIFSNTLGRNPYQIYREDFNSAHTNGHRIDNLLHVLGAVYGARLGVLSQPGLNGDAAFETMIRDGRMQKVSDSELQDLRKNPLSHYVKWRKIVAPDSAFYSVWGGSPALKVNLSSLRKK